MKSKWRYNVRLAEKRGITVRLGAAADLPAFYDLYAETGAARRLSDPPLRLLPHYLGDAAGRAGGPRKTRPAVRCCWPSTPTMPAPVAGLFLLLRYGDRAWYFYGASSERRRRDMPNYLLQWEALRWALAQGCTVYDWWGAPTQLDDPDDGMQGVWQFKQGFGAAFQPHIGAWDYPTWPPLYRAYTGLLPWLISLMRCSRRK
jgi:peptidoglycan pentaglycine glycine transferase (the first glycine)